MKDFKQYRRKQIAELRPITEFDIIKFKDMGNILFLDDPTTGTMVSISQEDLKSGSPKIGDMVARNPKNHLDQWLVAAEYFNDNFEEI